MAQRNKGLEEVVNGEHYGADTKKSSKQIKFSRNGGYGWRRFNQITQFFFKKEIGLMKRKMN